ncbi:MAG: ATP-dependent helicase, partial [Paludibacter sp.]|jgi:superfamily I DNA/RNA helicase|nr:ATP-dependent helicase [Paludibacter sp.]
MIKVENFDLIELWHKAKNDQHERVRDFYKIALPLIREYNKYCVDKSYLDFNDLITRCISLFQKEKDIAERMQKKYRYILVDEFQDVNNLQVEFIKLLLTEQSQLFCVGDDWQSIYGFRGSDVSYIIEFERHFPQSKIVKLNLNYRSTQNIVGASNEVIKHNKFKIDKEILASKYSEKKNLLFSGNSEEENLKFCVEEVKQLLKDGYKNDEILFLYRRNHMFHNPLKPEQSYRLVFQNEQIKVQSKTIHAAKGLEAKVVFIIGLTEGNGGFPDIWMEDRIFQTIKKANHDLLMEEERRLFYVAITRAKEKLFLISQKDSESGFISEIPNNFIERIDKPIQLIQNKVLLCQNCYCQIDGADKFCKNCGAKIEKNSNPLRSSQI